MKKFAVIVAGGMGKRMGHSIPKQFLLIQGKPVLWYTIDAFLRAYDDLQLVVVLPDEFQKDGIKITSAFSRPIKVVKGGETRFHSVKNGLQEVEEDSVVFIHDGVRCLISIPLIHRCYNSALQFGNAIPAVTATDSIRMMKNGYPISESREFVKIIQTPQTFLSSIIKPAFDRPYHPDFTDEATVVENAGEKIHLVEGEFYNIKITRPLDLYLAEKIISSR